MLISVAAPTAPKAERRSLRRLATAILAASLAGLSACAHQTQRKVAPLPSNPDRQGDPTPTATLQRPRAPFVPPSSYAAFIRGELLADRGDYAQAAKYYDQALTSAQPDVYLLSRYAEALGRSGEESAAADVLAEAQALDPRATLPDAVRADLALSRGDRQGAIAAYGDALQRNPSDGQIALDFAELLVSSGAFERAIEVWTTLSQRDPTHSKAATQAQLRLAVQRDDPLAVQHAVADLQVRGVDAPYLEALAKELLAHCRFGLAALLLTPLPATNSVAPLQLQAWLGVHNHDAARDLLLSQPDDVFGGPLRTAAALLAVGEPAQALDRATVALALEHGAEGPATAKARILIAAAHLQLKAPQQALASLQATDLAGTQREAASRVVTRTLRSAGLSGLAEEIQRGDAPHAKP